MKKHKFVIILFIAVIISNPLKSQVGIGTETPHGSAAVDISSATRGFLLPRMNYAAMESIAGPAEGLLIYCTDCGPDETGTLAIFTNGVWNVVNVTCLDPDAPAEGSHVASVGQVTWNWTSVASAGGYKWNTASDYATATDLGMNTSTTESGLTCGTAYTRYVWAYNSCGESAAVPLNQSTGDCWECGDPLPIEHITGDVAPVNKSVVYGTVTNIPGEPSKCWITSNLGASHQATLHNDTTEASAGWYWQFNRMQGYKHSGITRTPSTGWISTVISENLNWEPANDPCTIELGSPWRMTTETEWINVDAAASWTEWTGPWESDLHVHAAGYLGLSNGGLVNRGLAGNYWTSIQNDGVYGRLMNITNTLSQTDPSDKRHGMTIRCIQ